MAKVKKINCFWDDNGTEYLQTEYATEKRPDARPLLAIRVVFKDESLVTILDKRAAHKLINELEDFIDA